MKELTETNTKAKTRVISGRCSVFVMMTKETTTQTGKQRAIKTALNKWKRNLTQPPHVAHYKSYYTNVVTTDTSPKGMSATVWQKQPVNEKKPTVLPSRHLIDTEK